MQSNNFKKSLNALADMQDQYAALDEGAPANQKVTTTTSGSKKIPTAPVQRQEQPRRPVQQQTQQQMPQSRSTQNVKNSNRSNSQNRTPQKSNQKSNSQQKHQPSQTSQNTQNTLPKETIGSLTQPHNLIIQHQPQQVNLDFMQKFKKNIQLASFFEALAKQEKEYSNYFYNLSQADVQQSKNGFTILNFTIPPKVKKLEHQQSGPQYEDFLFPPDDQVLTWNSIPTQNTQWARPSEMIENYPITVFENVMPEKVIQGSLGDCFLISAISVLADSQQLLKRLVESNGNGKYTVWLCPDGRWKPIVVDDLFPVRGGRFINAQPFQGDIGVMLLEKAYAKQYRKNYKRIEVGYSLDALKDLTGAPCEYIDIKVPQQAFKMIQESLDKGWVLTVSSKTNGQDNGVVSKHCYGLMDTRSIVVPGAQSKTYNLIKLRNPYGSNSYLQVQHKMPQAVQDKLNEPLIQANGVFWMSLEEFIKDFEVVTVCKIFTTYLHQFIKYKSDQLFYGNQATLTTLRVGKKTHLHIGIHQKHTRYFKKTPNDSETYNYQVSRLILCKLGGNGNNLKIIDVIDGAFSCQQSTFLEAYLEQGDYLIYGEVDGDQIINQKVLNDRKLKSYVISCYSENPVTLEMVEGVSQQNSYGMSMADSVLFEAMYKYITSKAPQKAQEWFKFIAKQDDGLVTRYHGTGFGHVFIYHINECTRNTFIDCLEFNQLKNVNYYRDSNNGDKQFDGNWSVQLSPTASSLILFKILNQDNCSHKMVFLSKSLFELNMSWEELKNKAIAEGQAKKRQRAGKDINVLFYQYKFNGGVMVNNHYLYSSLLIQLIYKNQTSEQYQEDLEFKNLENCVPVDKNEQPYPTKRIQVQVKPNETFGIKLRYINKQNAAFKYQMTFS